MEKENSMKVNTLASGIILSFLLFWTTPLFAQNTNSNEETSAMPSAKPSMETNDAAARPPSSSTETSTDDHLIPIKVPLFFIRQASKVKAILDADSAATNSSLRGLVVNAPVENMVILYGTRDQITDAQRLIASIDLPEPSVQMDMWGIQVSSSNPQQMQVALKKVRGDIAEARSAVRELDLQLQNATSQYLNPKLAGPGTAEAKFKDLLTNKATGSNPGLGYTDALMSDRALSISDILLHLIAGSAQDDVKFANGITQRLGYDLSASSSNQSIFRRKYQEILSPEMNKQSIGFQSTILPFRHLFESRGLIPVNQTWELDPSGTTQNYNQLARISVIRFTFNYANMVEEPDKFSPYELQQTSDTLNSRLQLAVDSINQDIADLIIKPTLEKIKRDLAETTGVEYAQVGDVQVASLNGVETKVTGTSVSAFATTSPLLPSDIIHDASSTPTSGVPSSQLISLLAATDKDRTTWNELSQGVTLNVTPNVLRNASSAELDIHLTIGDPQAGTREAGVPPLSRVSQHDVQDTIYLNALDIFDLSTFSSQATLNGGRDYVPLVGPIWHGVFGDVPVLGDLFSWKKNPKTIYHQSILFANTIINPTAMQLALLYPVDNSSRRNPDLVEKLQRLVLDYSMPPDDPNK